MDSLSTDQLTELLTLADRYEVLICYLDIFFNKRKIILLCQILMHILKCNESSNIFRNSVKLDNLANRESRQIFFLEQGMFII